MQVADRLLKTPPYPFAELARLKREAIAQGVDLINFGIGDPDQPTPDFVVQAMQQAVTNPAYHPYDETDMGLPLMLEAIAAYFQRRFGVTLDPSKEILRLIGSKEGIAHMAWAVLNPGDVVLVPDPGYPVYKVSTLFADAQSYFMPVSAERNYAPDLAAIPADVAARAKMMWLCYPNNPTGGTVELDFLAEAVAFAKQHDILICMDLAYAEVYYDDSYQPPSILQVPGGKDVAIEFHSFSKPFNMTGWRIGWACGNVEAINALNKIKSNIDSGQFLAIQEAAAAALNYPQVEEYLAGMRAMYRRRRDLLVDGLNAAGWQVTKPRGGFYIWAPTPGGMSSADCAAKLLTECGILATPGSAYGPNGDGFIRFALTLPAQDQEARIAEAVQRIKANF